MNALERRLLALRPTLYPSQVPAAFTRLASQAELEKRAVRVRKRTADSVAGGLINDKGVRIVTRAAYVAYEDSR